MLTIRLSRTGRRNLPFFRVVLTEHHKPVKCGYSEVLGRYNPLNHQSQIDVEKVKALITKWAKPSERVAKLLFKSTNDQLFKSFFVERARVKAVKNPD